MNVNLIINDSEQIKKSLLNEFKIYGEGKVIEQLSKLQGFKYSGENSNLSTNLQNNQTEKLGLKKAIVGDKSFVNIKFEKTTYINSFGNKVTTPELEINICTIDYYGRNKSAITSPINQNFEVIEVLGKANKAIQISGVIIGGFDRTKPVEETLLLNEICDSGIFLKVTSEYLNNFGVEYLFIDSFNIPQETQYLNLQKFEIRCFGVSPDKM